MKRKTKQASKASPVYKRIRQILESARTNVARSVNTTQVVANWLIGREIVEEEQKGLRRAGYGERLIEGLSRRLTEDFGRGFTFRNLESFRIFNLDYPDLVPIPHALRAELNEGTISDALSRKRVSGDPSTIGYAVRSQSGIISRNTAGLIRHAVRDEFSEACENSEAARRKSEISPIQGKQPNQHAVRVESSLAVTLPKIGHALRGESWQPGQLHPNLSWTHYRTLLRVDKPEARAFCKIDAIKRGKAGCSLKMENLRNASLKPGQRSLFGQEGARQ